jgi:hypothetical protein
MSISRIFLVNLALIYVLLLAYDLTLGSSEKWQNRKQLMLLVTSTNNSLMIKFS